MNDMTKHNVIGLTEADFLHWQARLSDADLQCKVANEKRAKIRKEMRAAGIKLTQFDAMAKLAALGRDEQADLLAHSKAYLTWLKSPLGTQMSLDLPPVSDDPDMPDEERVKRVVEDATSGGWQAGMKGDVWEDDNPHEANTEAGKAWNKAYRAAQKQRAKALSGVTVVKDDEAAA